MCGFGILTISTSVFTRHLALMSRTYQATGINLQAQPMGESDRLVTILTREFGLIRVIAPGARKHLSSLGGRSGMFVVNELLIAKGRSLDKITQAQTLKSYAGLSLDLGKLAASQYLIEMVLAQALSEQPQEELYDLLNQHLQELAEIPRSNRWSILRHLVHAVFNFLTLSGMTPEVQVCCLTGRDLIPDFNQPKWQVGFSVPAGGTLNLTAWQQNPEVVLSRRLNATELAILQQLSEPQELFATDQYNPSWLRVEQILRSYTQYHFERPIRSAALIDSYFDSLISTNHDATV
jgi:DNA repair protein RecO (recombination protein O)